MEASGAQESELRSRLRVLRRRKAWVIAPAIVLVALAVARSESQTSLYRSEARILLQARRADKVEVVYVDPERLVTTEIEVLKSLPVQEAVRKRLGRSYSVSAVVVGTANMMAVRATSTSPRLAASIANAYAEEYIAFRRQQAINDTMAPAAELESQLADVQKQIDELPAIDPRVAVDAGALPPDRVIQVAPATRRDHLIDQEADLRKSLDALKVDAMLKTGGAQIVVPATPSSVRISPKPVSKAVTAVILGLLLGVALAFARDYLDPTIRSPDDVERLAWPIPILGRVPTARRRRRSSAPVSQTDPESAAADAYRTLRTAVQFSGMSPLPRTIQVTSASDGDGKTTTTANLALAFARGGRKVTVVCCDLRQPGLAEMFGVSETPGFTTAVLGEVPVTSVVYAAANEPGLSVVPSGPLPADAAAVLSSPQAGSALRELAADADIVLIDSGPVLPGMDGVALAPHVDATLLVARRRATRRADLAQSLELLQRAEAKLMGTVLVDSGAVSSRRRQQRVRVGNLRVADDDVSRIAR